MGTSTADFLYTLSARLDGEVSAVFATFERQGQQAGQRVSQAVSTVGTSAARSSEALRGAAAAARLFEGGIGGVATRVAGLNELLRVAGGYIAGPFALIAGAAAFINYGSTIQSAQARLRAMTDSTAEFNQAQAQSIAIAKDTRTSLVDTINLYTRLSAVSKSQGLTQPELGGVITAIQKTTAIQGLGEAQQNSVLTEFSHAAGSNFESAGRQLRILSQETPLLVQEIVKGLKALGVVNFDGTTEGLRKLATEGKLNTKLVADALIAMSGDLDTRFKAAGVTINQAKSTVGTAFAQLVIGVEQSTNVLGGAASGIVFLSNHLTELGGILTVVGAAFAASYVAPLLASAVAIVPVVAETARLVLGFEGAAVSLGTMALGFSEARIGLTTLLGSINPVVAALTVAAGAAYYFSTRASIAEQAAKILGVSQDELRDHALGAAHAIGETNFALQEQARLANQSKLTELTALALRGRSTVSLRVGSAADEARASGRSDQAAALDDLNFRYQRNALSANDVVKAAAKLNLPKESYAGLVAAADQSIAAANGFVRLTNALNGTPKTVAGTATTVATQTIKQIQDAARVAATAGDSLAGVEARYRAAVDALNAKFKPDEGKGGTFEDPAKAAEYQTEIQQIEATRQQGIEAVHATAQAKREAAKEDREAKAAQAKTDAENFKFLADAGRAQAYVDKQANEEKAKAVDLVKKIADATNDQPKQDTRLDDLSQQNFVALIAGAETFGQYLKNDAAIAGAIVKPLREAAAQAQLLAATDNLVLSGNTAAGEVLRRAVELRREGVDLSKIDLDTINAQVAAETKRGEAIGRQNDLINVYARSAGQIQTSFRDLFAGGSFANLGKSLAANLKNSLADELSIKIFGNAEQDARDRMTGALGANSDALDAVRAALADYAAAIRNPAAIGEAVGEGVTETLARLTSSPLSGVASNDNGGLLPSVDNPAVAQAQAGRLLGAGGALGGILGSAFALFSSSNNRLSSSLGGVTAAIGGGTGSANLPRGAGASFAANLSKQLGQLGDFLDKKLGLGSVGANGRQVAGSGALGRAGSAVGSFVGGALQGYTQGQAVTGILQGIGILGKNSGSKAGGVIGAAIGQAIPVIGSTIGSILGTIVGSIFGGVNPRAFQQLTIAGGVAVTGGSRARGDNQAQNLDSAGQEATAFSSALNSLASTFGASLKSGANLGEIGVYGGKYGFHQHFGDGGGDVQTFASAQEAVAAAIKYAINTGAVEGLRDGTKRLLTAAGDFTAQTTKAQKYESVFTDLKAAVDPVGAAIDTVNKKFTDLSSIFAEAGASATDYASLQQLYDIQRAAALKTAESSAVTTLQDYLTSLKTDSSTGLSARDREASALATFNPLADQVTAGKTVDQDKFKAAADALLSVDKELFGSTNDYFTRLSQITGLTQKAIDNVTAGTTGATASTASVLTFGSGAAAANDNIGTLNDSILAVGNTTNDLLRQLIAANGGGTYYGLSGKVANF